MDHSKVSTSVMFAAAADGTLLAPYVCYKAEHLYNTWMENGPRGTHYNRSKSGWFTAEIFEDWFNTVAVSYFRRLSGPKYLIGDNLSSHISFATIKRGLEEGIHFIFLPPNSTHLLQPLDYSVFRPIKRHWCAVLKNWKRRNCGVLPKSVFPQLLRETIEQAVNLKTDIISGFQATGMFPVNADVVLTKIPEKENEMEIGMRYLAPLVNVLGKARCVSNTYLPSCSFFYTFT